MPMPRTFRRTTTPIFSAAMVLIASRSLFGMALLWTPWDRCSACCSPCPERPSYNRAEDVITTATGVSGAARRLGRARDAGRTRRGSGPRRLFAIVYNFGARHRDLLLRRRRPPATRFVSRRSSSWPPGCTLLPQRHDLRRRARSAVTRACGRRSRRANAFTSWSASASIAVWAVLRTSDPHRGHDFLGPTTWPRLHRLGSAA